MAYNNRGNNNGNSNKGGFVTINTTSRGPQMYNVNTEEDNSTLVLSLWNDNAIFKIHPALEKKTKEGKVFDYDSELTIVVNLKNLYNLKKGLANLLGKNPKYDSIGVESVGKDGVTKRLVISKGLFTEGDQLALSIFVLNEDSTADSVLTYIFNYKTEKDDALIVNYDPESGKSKKIWTNPEITILTDWINDACEALRNATCHGSNKALKQTEAKLETKIEGNVIKGGSNSSGSGGKKFGSYKKRNLGVSREELDDDDTTDLDEEMSTGIEEEEVDDIEDLEDMLED